MIGNHLKFFKKSLRNLKKSVKNHQNPGNYPRTALEAQFLRFLVDS